LVIILNCCEKIKGVVMADETKVKGVADIVILLDVTGSMQVCINAVKRSVSDFISIFSSSDANGAAPITDWRMKIVGYRDSEAGPSDWFIDNPFVTDVAAIQAQLAAENMKASGGGDEPESLLDALIKLAKMDQSGVQDPVDPNKWRARRASARAIIFFTDATFKKTITIPEAAGGTVTDVITAITQQRILLAGFCPEWEGYLDLGSTEGCYIDFVAKLKDTPALAGFGKSQDEVKAAQMAAAAALDTATGDPAKFTKLLETLAKTLQLSVQAESA
jgi:hypothetical protein